MSIMRFINKNNITPWEALLEYANLTDLLSLNDDDKIIKEEVGKEKFIPYDIRY